MSFVADRLIPAIQAIGADVKTMVRQPVNGVKSVQQFAFTDATVARPNVPTYVVLNWIGPAGVGGTAPTNMAVGDTWDLEV